MGDGSWKPCLPPEGASLLHAFGLECLEDLSQWAAWATPPSSGDSARGAGNDWFEDEADETEEEDF